jgi:hypothetical protein
LSLFTLSCTLFILPPIFSGKYNQAAPLYEKALEIRLDTYGGRPHPSVAEMKNNMAMLYFAQGGFILFCLMLCLFACVHVTCVRLYVLNLCD